MTRTDTTTVTAYGCTREEAALFRLLAPACGVITTLSHLELDETTAELAMGAHVSVGHKVPVDGSALEALARHGVTHLVSRSIGLDHIDVEHARRIGIGVEGVTYSPDSVADYTLMLILMAVRHARSSILRAESNDFRLNPSRGRELRDLTVGVVGTGRIGAAVVERLRGFGGTVLTHDLHPSHFGAHVGIDDLVASSDVVTLHTPLTPSTHHLLNRTRISRMRHGAVVVNTGRGGLVDTEALLVALEAGHLGGAALDVVEGEQGAFYSDLREAHQDYPALRRLLALPNVVVTPHTAFDTDHALADIVRNSLLVCLAWDGRHDG